MNARSQEELWALLPAHRDAPIRPGCNRYRVTVIEWLSHDIVLDAVSAEAAEELAAELRSDLDGDAFRFRDSGLDGFQVDEIERGAL